MAFWGVFLPVTASDTSMDVAASSCLRAWAPTQLGVSICSWDPPAPSSHLPCPKFTLNVPGIGFSLGGWPCRALSFLLARPLHLPCAPCRQGSASVCRNRHPDPRCYGQGVGTGMKITRAKAWEMKGPRPDLLGR